MMRDTANSLLKIQEYDLFKLLKIELVELERLILTWQNYLREQISTQQLSLYF